MATTTPTLWDRAGIFFSIATFGVLLFIFVTIVLYFAIAASSQFVLEEIFKIFLNADWSDFYEKVREKQGATS